MECQENHDRGVIRPAYSAQKDAKRSLLRWADPHVRKSAALAPSFPACLRLQGNADSIAESDFTQCFPRNLSVKFYSVGKFFQKQ